MTTTAPKPTKSLPDLRPAPEPAAVEHPSREHKIFLAATGVIAVHVADDNFFQPNPGTSAADHLVSGLVPLALLALAATSYGRLRAGFRAAIAIVVGLFGVTAGTEAAHYMNTVGLSGDDYSGLLSIPAGLGLIGLGFATLWRSRRTAGSRSRCYARRALLAAAGVVGAFYLVFPVLLGYATTHSARGYVPEEKLGAAYEDVKLHTSDGLELEGWYVPSRNGAAVISFPGRKGTQDPARMLARHGYGVLLFDRRGEGRSEGDPNSWGWGGDKDIRAAVDFLKGRPDVEPGRIGGVGLSVGGEMMLEAAGEGAGLDAVISEGAGGRSIREELGEEDGAGKALALPLVALKSASVAVFSNTAVPPKITDLMDDISPTPVFLIYSGRPDEKLNEDYYRAARAPKQIWSAGGGHVGAIREQPREYERRVVGFFDETLLEGR
jgi:hypothetical protein